MASEIASRRKIHGTAQTYPSRRRRKPREGVCSARPYSEASMGTMVVSSMYWSCTQRQPIITYIIAVHVHRLQHLCTLLKYAAWNSLLRCLDSMMHMHRGSPATKHQDSVIPSAEVVFTATIFSARERTLYTNR